MKTQLLPALMACYPLLISVVGADQTTYTLRLRLSINSTRLIIDIRSMRMETLLLSSLSLLTKNQRMKTDLLSKILILTLLESVLCLQAAHLFLKLPSLEVLLLKRLSSSLESTLLFVNGSITILMKLLILMLKLTVLP